MTEKASAGKGAMQNHGNIGRDWPCPVGGIVQETQSHRQAPAGSGFGRVNVITAFTGARTGTLSRFAIILTRAKSKDGPGKHGNALCARKRDKVTVGRRLLSRHLPGDGEKRVSLIRRASGTPSQVKRKSTEWPARDGGRTDEPSFAKPWATADIAAQEAQDRMSCSHGDGIVVISES